MGKKTSHPSKYKNTQMHSLALQFQCRENSLQLVVHVYSWMFSLKKNLKVKNILLNLNTSVVSFKFITRLC